jgi:hypothetical protein
MIKWLVPVRYSQSQEREASVYHWIEAPHVVVPDALVYGNSASASEMLTILRIQNLGISLDHGTACGSISSFSVSKD